MLVNEIKLEDGRVMRLEGQDVDLNGYNVVHHTYSHDEIEYEFDPENRDESESDQEVFTQEIAHYRHNLKDGDYDEFNEGFANALQINYQPQRGSEVIVLHREIVERDIARLKQEREIQQQREERLQERRRKRGLSVIWETVVYCGRLKEWRILNLLSGTVYSNHYNTREEAYAAIEDGTERDGKIVKRVTLEKIRDRLPRHRRGG